MSEKNPLALVAINMAQIEKALVEGVTFEMIEPELKAVAANVDLAASLMDRFEVNEEYLRKEAAQYQEAAQYWAKAKSYLKQMIKGDMEANGVTDLLGTNKRFKLSYGKDKIVIDESKLPAKYIMHVPQPDKKKIEEAIANGFEVPGVTLEKVPKLNTYIVKKADK